MTNENQSSSNRREFLTGRAIRTQIEQAGGALADSIVAPPTSSPEPSGGDTLRLATRAMACDFAAIMNPGPAQRIDAASEALNLVNTLETQLSVYRPDSEMTRLNEKAASCAVTVESQLYALLTLARDLCLATNGCFDPTSGPLIALWRQCRAEGHIPSDDEVEWTLARTGIHHVLFDERVETIAFDRPGIELNLGGIGKGYSLDRAGAVMHESGVGDFLLHGGHSSLLAAGDHNQLGGWPVGIRNPLFPAQRLVTVLLADCAMSSSGSGVQYFRHRGKRYGHILDPRIGRPVEGMLSVTVLAPTAAEADALSTAFFVMGVESSREYCDNNPSIRALLIPPPHRGRTLEPVNCGLTEEVLFYAPT